MASSDGAISLTFGETTFDLVEHSDGQIWLRYPQLAGPLGYERADRVLDVYNRNAAEFTDTMTALVKLPTAGGVQEVRIFSLRGAHLLGMFARTERAAEFRRWVLDVLDQQLQPAAPAAPARLVGQTFERVLAERDLLRGMLGKQLLKDKPRYHLVLKYFGIPGLSHRERALLCGWKSSGPWFDALRELSACGLVDWQPDPGKQERGRRHALLALQRHRDGTGPRLGGKKGTGASPEQMARVRQARSEKLAAMKAKP